MLTIARSGMKRSPRTSMSLDAMLLAPLLSRPRNETLTKASFSGDCVYVRPSRGLLELTQLG